MCLRGFIQCIEQFLVLLEHEPVELNCCFETAGLRGGSGVTLLHAGIGAQLTLMIQP